MLGVAIDFNLVQALPFVVRDDRDILDRRVLRHYRVHAECIGVVHEYELLCACDLPVVTKELSHPTPGGHPLYAVLVYTFWEGQRDQGAGELAADT